MGQGGRMSLPDFCRSKSKICPLRKPSNTNRPPTVLDLPPGLHEKEKASIRMAGWVNQHYYDFIIFVEIYVSQTYSV